MASKYYDDSGKEVFDGDVALASDLNTINSAIDSGFQVVESDLDGVLGDIEIYSDLAEKWAENPENIAVEAGKYSALHWSAKATASASSASSSASTATTQAGIATTRAGEALASKNAADADVLLTNADVLLTNADVVTTGGYRSETLGYRDSASGYATIATTQAGIATDAADSIIDTSLTILTTNDGSENVTSVIQAAIDTCEKCVLPPGSYLVDTLYIPNNSTFNSVVSSDGTERAGCFIGTPQTILIQNDPTKPVIQKSETNGRVYGWTIGPFVFKPHASGSSVEAVDLSGMSLCTIDRLRGLSNAGNGFYSLIRLNCSPVPGLGGGTTRQCHGNRIVNPSLEKAEGYTKMIWFDDGGLGATYFANANYIIDPVCYNIVSLTSIIDAAKSYGVTVSNPTLEACTNAIGVIMGESTLILGGSLETLYGSFDYSQAYASRTSVIGTHLQTMGSDVNFASTSASNTWQGVIDYSGRLWAGDGAKVNGNTKGIAIRFTPGAIPTGVSIVRITGVAATLTETSATTVVPWSSERRTITYLTETVINPSSSGILRFGVSDPYSTSGITFSRVTQEITVYETATSIPIAVAAISNTAFLVNVDEAKDYTAIARITFLVQTTDMV